MRFGHFVGSGICVSFWAVGSGLAVEFGSRRLIAYGLNE